MAKDIELYFDDILPDRVKFSLREELNISEDIDSEVDKASATFGFYAVMSEKASARLSKLNFAFEKWKNKTQRDTIIQRDNDGLRKLTIKQMEEFLKSIPMYQSYQLRVVEYEEQRNILRSITKAFEFKCNLVQTKAANRRREIN